MGNFCPCFYFIQLIQTKVVCHWFIYRLENKRHKTKIAFIIAIIREGRGEATDAPSPAPI